MKRALLFLLLFVFLLPLGAVELVSAVEVDEDFLSRLEAVINRAGRNVIPPEVESITLTSYEENENAVLVEIEGYRFAFNRNHLSSSMREEVEDFFTYPPFLPAQGENRLDYIYDSSFSTYNLEGASKGQIYDLKAPFENKYIARFIVSETHDDGLVELEPLYVKRAYSGLELVRKPAWKLTLSFSPAIYPNFSLLRGSARIKNLSWFAPFNPSVGIDVAIDESGSLLLTGMVGIEREAHLGGLVDSTFTLIQDGHLYAGVDFAFSYNEGFIWGAAWRAGYSHYLSRHFSWSLGVENVILRSEGSKSLIMNEYRLSLSIGVTL